MVTIRQADPADRARVVRTMTRAFIADPLIRWFFPDDDTYEDEAALFFGVMFELRVDAGSVWCTDDVAGAACWEGPDGHPRGKDWMDTSWSQGMASLPQRARDRLDQVGAATSPHAAPVPKWYLALLGTHPDWQRQGVGRAVLTPVLEVADRDGLHAELVTESPENVAFYRGLGFDVAAEPELDGGPHIWVMHRSPR